MPELVWYWLKTNALPLGVFFGTITIVFGMKGCGVNKGCGYNGIGMPGGALFSTILIYFFSKAGGLLTLCVRGLPPLIGMIIAGFVLVNAKMIDSEAAGFSDIVSTLKGVALALIMIRAGLRPPIVMNA